MCNRLWRTCLPDGISPMWPLHKISPQQNVGSINGLSDVVRHLSDVCVCFMIRFMYGTFSSIQ